jgi:hypothetical protein
MVQAVAFFVVDAVFRGSLILIPVLFAIHLLKFGTTAINKPVLIRAANYMLLLGSVIPLFLLLTVLISACFADEYDRYTYLNRLFGPYWFAYWFFVFIPYGLLPQLLWLKRLRRSIIASFIIIMIWGLLTFVTIIPGLYIKLSPGPEYDRTTWMMFTHIESAHYLGNSRPT